MSKACKKAVVLAAGLGTRLRPLTNHLPKPLLPIWGEPMLERILRMLEAWGVEEIAVNAHHLADKIRQYVHNRQGKAKIIVSEESEILGTGGVLNPLKSFIGDTPFWLVNGDIVIEDLEEKPLVEAFDASGRFASCWLREEGPRTVEADPQGRICNWKSEDAGAAGTYTYCGVALLAPDILKYVKESGFSTIVEAYEKAMMTDGRFVRGVVMNEAFWWDAGTIERFRAINDGPQSVSAYAHEGLDKLVAALGWQQHSPGAEILCVRGSDRAFWKLDTATGKTAIGIEYDAGKRPENARYAAHARVLKAAGVSVPDVLADVPEAHMMAMENCTGGSLQERAAKLQAHLVDAYTPVVQALARFHTAGFEAVRDVELESAFGPELYAWERDLFQTYAVRERFGFDALPHEVRFELEGVASELGRAQPRLVHRDFQSSNVLYRADGSLAIIDFQGMRLGPAAYDLGSLLYDPYVSLTDAERKALVKVYAKAASDVKDAITLLPLASVQRLVQVLGAFGRLASVGQTSFTQYFLPALSNLLSVADEANLDHLGAFVEDLIAREQIRLGGFAHLHHAHSSSART